MAAAAAIRSVIRPATILRRAAVVAEMRSATSPRVSTLRPTARRFLRYSFHYVRKCAGLVHRATGGIR
jgi:hypothetical protein